MKPRTWYVFAKISGMWRIDWRGDMEARKRNDYFFAPSPFFDLHPAPYKE